MAVEPMIRMAPVPLAIMWAEISRQAQMQAKRFVRRVSISDSVSRRVTGRCQAQPALLTYRSIRPKVEMALLTISTTRASSLRSRSIDSTFTPRERSWAIALGSGSKPAMARSTPSDARVLAIPNPMPLAPPVIRAVFPLSPVSRGFSYRCIFGMKVRVRHLPWRSDTMAPSKGGVSF